ncbi:MAG: redox-sensing transcriptional repressor Rex, partial [Acidimicrobiia bacterium]|nr:redox-sensing transcriptional repressor Rex [Acidimicrobiia bacterium]
LSFLGGTTGTRGVGYETDALRDLLSRALGLGELVPVVLVGAGNLGSALAGYGGFSKLGFRIAGIHDIDHIGRQVGGVEVVHIDRLKRDAKRLGYAIGVIATPATAAQDVAGLLVDAGVRAILNFAPAVIHVPPGVTVRQVDLATELQVLSYYLSRK